jgi:hypothetical protein
MTRIAFRILAVASTLLWALPVSRASAADTPGPRPRAALVIGVGDYTAMNPLESSANDAHDMCEALTGLGYSTSCFVNVKDSREFKARIQDFTAALKPKSEAVFYYAGHAIQVRGENYLVPAGAKLRTEADVARETISLSYVMAQLLQGKHYLNIVILDACRGNPWHDNPRGMTAGLAPITAIPRGTMVMYATAPEGSPPENGQRNGVLTKDILANISVPGLTADEFFKRVSEAVQADAAATDGGTQIPALYTNFTGEFCFAGCIDKVARAELERIEKANEEQLEQAHQQRAELEARKLEAQRKLLETAISTNCGKSVLGDTGRCFAATQEMVLKAIATAYTQRGFMLRDGSIAEGQLGAMRITDDPTDKNVSDILVVSATVRNLASIGRRVVTLSAVRRSVLHDEYHTWGAISIVPVATSKQYRDVVRKEVTVADSGFYQDLLAAIERNVRGFITAAAGSGELAREPEAATAPSTDDTPRSADHEHRYHAAPDRTERALIGALVSQGYLVRTLNPELGSIDLFRTVQDPKDKRYVVHSTLTASVTTPEDGAGSQAQLSADDELVLHREPGGRVMRGLSGDYRAEHDAYETRVVHDAAVDDAGLYRGLFAAAEATLRGESVPSKHAKHAALSAEQALLAAKDALTQRGFDVSSLDAKLGLMRISKRTAIPLSSNDGWTASYIDATVYIDAGAANDAIFYVAATSQDAIFHASPIVSHSWLLGERYKSAALRHCRAKKCSIDELEERFAGSADSAHSLESVIREGEADAAVYGEIFSIIDQGATKTQ